MSMPKPVADPKLSRLELALLADRERQLAEARRALESLTPGGSEYVADAARCVAYVRDRRDQQHRILVDFKQRAESAEAKLRAVGELRDELRRDKHLDRSIAMNFWAADRLDAILGGTV